MTPTPELPPDIIESLLAIGPVEWGQTYCQSDEKHIEDFADSLRITREFFGIEAEETTIQYISLAGTSTILAFTGNSPNSPQNARILAGAWNQLVDIAKGKAAAPAPLPVAVKALEWKEWKTGSRGWQVDTVLGQYQVAYLGEYEEWQLYCPNKSTTWKDCFSRHSSSQDAKAAAQADYEARIRSALSSPVGGMEESNAKKVTIAREPILYGPYGYLNGSRALTEDTWQLENDPIENDSRCFSIPLYAKVELSYPVSASPAPLPVAVKARPSYDQVIEVVLKNLRRMHDAGESHRMAARWISEDLDKLYVASPVGGTEGNLANALTMTGCENEEDLIDMANVGRSLMESIDFFTKSPSLLENWSPAESPVEIVGDLYDRLEEALSPTPSSDIAALREETSHKTDLLGYANVYRLEHREGLELGSADIDNLKDVEPWAADFQEHVGIAEIRLLPDTAGKSGADLLAALQHVAKGERG